MMQEEGSEPKRAGGREIGKLFSSFQVLIKAYGRTNSVSVFLSRNP